MNQSISYGMQTKPAGEIERVLEDLVKVTESINAILITKEGTAVSEAGDNSYLNTTALAALIAGMFTATREVARMVGEEKFSILLQQGENRHIHISLVTESIMMVVIFENYQAIGRVRHEARKTGRILYDLLENTDNSKEVPSDLSVPQFKEYALNLIDRIFVSK